MEVMFSQELNFDKKKNRAY